jgi:hypothetical protein
MIMSTLCALIVIVTLLCGVEMTLGWFVVSLIGAVTISCAYADKVSDNHFQKMSGLAAGSQIGFVMHSVMAETFAINNFSGLTVFIVCGMIGWMMMRPKFPLSHQALSVSFVAAFMIVSGCAQLFGVFPTMDKAVLASQEWQIQEGTAVVFLAYTGLLGCLTMSFAQTQAKQQFDAKQAYSDFTKIDSLSPLCKDQPLI